jgi:HSP20 family protein
MNQKEKRKLFGMFNSKNEEIIPMPEQNEDTKPEEAPLMEPESFMADPDAEEELEGQLAVDMFQTKDSIVLKSTIAGVRPENIDVSVNENILTITGERVQEEEVKEKDYYMQECYWGEFSRSVEIPADFDPEGISAEIKDGILTVIVPKTEKSKPKKIQVKG